MKTRKIAANLADKGVKNVKCNVIKRCGRYALLSRENPTVPYIVACGYDEKTGEWNQGYPN